MQQPFEIYMNYSSTQFAMDDYFIEWVYHPSEENTAFWLEFQNKFPEQVKNINKSRDILLSIHAANESISEDVKIKVWKNIISHSNKGKIFKMPNRRFWMAAASVFVLLVGISYFLLINDNKILPTENAGNEVLKNDILPGGNKATLTLADGSVIILDSVQTGAIANQGNVKIIKLDDGKLAYQKGNSKKETVHLNTITTPRGGQYQLILADSSRVWLNAASSITFPTSFAGDLREVKITGEAYFEVAHKTNMPFRVTVNGMEVQVLGTHFNINAYGGNDGIRTTLLEGSVNVTTTGQSALLTPGQQAQVLSGEIGVNNDVNLESVIAWKDGVFSFDKNSIQEVMRQLSRWYDVNIIFKGDVPNRIFSGSMKRDLTLSQVMKILEYNNIKYTIIGNQMIISE